MLTLTLNAQVSGLRFVKQNVFGPPDGVRIACTSSIAVCDECSRGSLHKFDLFACHMPVRCGNSP